MARGRANPYHKQLQTGRLIEKIRKDSEPMQILEMQKIIKLHRILETRCYRGYTQLCKNLDHPFFIF